MTKPTDGYTLLELLIALVLMGLLLALMSSALRLGAAAERRINERAALTDLLLRARGFLRDRLSDTRPVWLIGQTSGHVAFDGSDHELQFEASTPLSEGGIGLARYDVKFQPHGRFTRIVCSASPTDGRGGFTVGPVSFLADIPQDITVSYYGSQPTGGPAVWQTKWRNRSNLPVLVAIGGLGPSAELRAWPPLVIRLALDADVDCRLDTARGRCEGR